MDRDDPTSPRVHLATLETRKAIDSQLQKIESRQIAYHDSYVVVVEEEVVLPFLAGKVTIRELAASRYMYTCKEERQHATQYFTLYNYRSMREE